MYFLFLLVSKVAACLFVEFPLQSVETGEGGKLGYQEPGRTLPNFFFTQTRINLGSTVQNIVLKI